MSFYILVFCLGILAAFFAGAYIRKPFETGFFKGKGEKREGETFEGESDNMSVGEGSLEEAVKERQWSALLDYTVEQKK